MSVDQANLKTRRGDDVMVTLFHHTGEPSSILISVFDADNTMVPTAQFTLGEAAELRETLRKFCEKASNGYRAHRGG
jgi:hypothetical protein